MKKLFGIIVLATIILMPLKANAAASLSYEQSAADANGVFTVSVFMEVEAGTTYDTFNAVLKGNNAFITSLNGSTDFTLDAQQSTVISGNVSQANIVTKYNGLSYTGTGAKIKVAEFTYIHDPAAAADADCKITIALDGGKEVEVTSKTPANPKTGSMLPYAGIAAGIILIAGAFIISKKSTKLYRI